MKNVTGLTVFYRTPHLVDISIKAFRKYYPKTRLIIVNNSPIDDECTIALINVIDDNMELLQLDKNYGHGAGLNRGMKLVETPYVYIFDSDSEIVKEDLLENLASKMNSNTYGVGFTRLTSRGGQHTNGKLGDPDVITYLHPLACLISMHQYEKFPKFHSGGAPFCLAMSAIHDTGIADILLRPFPVIGLSKSRVCNNYIKHHGGSTRMRFGIPNDYEGF